MAYVQDVSNGQPVYRDTITPQSSSPPQQRPRQPQGQASKQRFAADLSQCLFDFVIQLLPTQEEMTVKEDVRKLLERLIRTIEPDSRLLSFGSTANGFSLRNSDMDLCCLIDSGERLNASDLVTMLGDLLERETKFHVKPLPHARIPIVKLTLDPSPGLPLGIACDIGFENRLALENTRLLMCYAMVDPTRVRTLVLFLKVWSKRRKINSPYKGTLSSYGYVLLVIYYLVHVKSPPVLPNLQEIPPLRPIPPDETHIGGFNVWFFDDIELLRQRWHSENTETVADLLIDFFRYYSREFNYSTSVVSIRAGPVKKEAKGWQSVPSGSRYDDSRERNRFCIEDPFEVDFNVARCVTKDGLYTIRGEFMRACRVLATRPDRAILALAELCEERKDEELVSAPKPGASRLSNNIPPQTPYTVGSQSMGTKGVSGLTPPTKFHEPTAVKPVVSQQVTIRPPPEHMAPKRSKYTSPPPPEAPPADHQRFDNQLDMGLEMATAPSVAREEDLYHSSGASEVFSDDASDAASDDVRSVRSFTEGSSSLNPSQFRRPPPWHHQTVPRMAPPQISLSVDPPSMMHLSPRGRVARLENANAAAGPSTLRIPPDSVIPAKSEFSRRSTSGPPRGINGLPQPGPSRPASGTPLAASIPLPPSPESSPEHTFSTFESAAATVYYQTPPARSPNPNVHINTHAMLYPTPPQQMSPLLQHYQLTQHQFYMGAIPPSMFAAGTHTHAFGGGGLMSPSGSPSDRLGPRLSGRLSDASNSSQQSLGEPSSPTPTPGGSRHHHNSASLTTVTSGPTPPAHVLQFAQHIHATTTNTSTPVNIPHQIHTQTFIASNSNSSSPVNVSNVQQQHIQSLNSSSGSLPSNLATTSSGGGRQANQPRQQNQQQQPSSASTGGGNTNASGGSGGGSKRGKGRRKGNSKATATTEGSTTESVSTSPPTSEASSVMSGILSSLPTVQEAATASTSSPATAASGKAGKAGKGTQNGQNQQNQNQQGQGQNQSKGAKKRSRSRKRRSSVSATASIATSTSSAPDTPVDGSGTFSSDATITNLPALTGTATAPVPVPGAGAGSNVAAHAPPASVGSESPALSTLSISSIASGFGSPSGTTGYATSLSNPNSQPSSPGTGTSGVGMVGSVNGIPIQIPPPLLTPMTPMLIHVSAPTPMVSSFESEENVDKFGGLRRDLGKGVPRTSSLRDQADNLEEEGVKPPLTMVEEKDREKEKAET